MAYRLHLLDPFLKASEPYKCPTCPYCNGQRDATVKYPKPDPWTWWKDMGSPRHVVAPMVDQSELPFRMFCRKYGADLCYTPMFNSRLFATDPEYRKQQWSTCPEDRPLFVQFCGHDADTVLAAARVVEDQCDAVDLNLGCPQGIAKKGHYGSFLMEHWDVIHTILHTLAVELKVPVVAKMRIFESEELTLRYARMIRDTGIHLIAVHGRTREMKGQQSGIADLDMIAKVKAHITSVPIIANGNIRSFADIPPNFERTKCEAVMSAEGLLWDPRLFANPERPILTGRTFQADKATRLGAIAAAKEYIAFAIKYPTPFANVKAHVFKMLHHSLEVIPDMRPLMGDLNGTKPNIPPLIQIVDGLEKADIERGPDGVYEKRPREKRDRPVGADQAHGAPAEAGPSEPQRASESGSPVPAAGEACVDGGVHAVQCAFCADATEGVEEGSVLEPPAHAPPRPEAAATV
jgi:tRNA-dihydrouridine synthase 1